MENAFKPLCLSSFLSMVWPVSLICHELVVTDVNLNLDPLHQIIWLMGPATRRPKWANKCAVTSPSPLLQDPATSDGVKCHSWRHANLTLTSFYPYCIQTWIWQLLHRGLRLWPQPLRIATATSCPYSRRYPSPATCLVLDGEWKHGEWNFIWRQRLAPSSQLCPGACLVQRGQRINRCRRWCGIED